MKSLLTLNPVNCRESLNVFDKTHGNSQPGQVGISANGSETHSMSRKDVAGMPLISGIINREHLNV